MNVLETIKNLREALNQHNYNYYVLDNPTISDFEFDQMEATAALRFAVINKSKISLRVFILFIRIIMLKI